MLFELHSHTNKHSKCSSISPDTLVKRVLAKGLQGLLITEHHYLWPKQEIDALKKDAGAPAYFVILSAQEVQTEIGHVLVIGAPETISESANTSILREKYPQACLIWAHPFRKGNIPKPAELLNLNIDAVEIFSLNHTSRENFLGLKMWHKLKFTAVSGSDTHSEDMAGAFPTQFDHEINDVEDLIDEIKNGNARPFFKEIPKSGSDLLITEITIGTKGVDETRPRIIVKSYDNPAKWEKAKESSKITQTLLNNGFSQGPFRVPKLLEINNAEQLLLEEGQRGKQFFELLSSGVAHNTAIQYLKMAARWLAELHNRALKITLPDDTIVKERKRFTNYYNTFKNSSNPLTDKIKDLVDIIREKEEIFFKNDSAGFIQIHGDYHPKNIIIGYDKMHDPNTVFVSVIDFANSMLFLPAFDVGYFLAQFQSQFFAYPEILRACPENIFTDEYLSYFKGNSKGFEEAIAVLKIRANLSIAAYFIKVGLGESIELKTLINTSLELAATE